MMEVFFQIVFPLLRFVLPFLVSSPKDVTLFSCYLSFGLLEYSPVSSFRLYFNRKIENITKKQLKEVNQEVQKKSISKEKKKIEESSSESEEETSSDETTDSDSDSYSSTTTSDDDDSDDSNSSDSGSSSDSDSDSTSSEDETSESEDDSDGSSSDTSSSGSASESESSSDEEIVKSKTIANKDINVKATSNLHSKEKEMTRIDSKENHNGKSKKK